MHDFAGKLFVLVVTMSGVCTSLSGAAEAALLLAGSSLPWVASLEACCVAGGWLAAEAAATVLSGRPLSVPADAVLVLVSLDDSSSLGYARLTVSKLQQASKQAQRPRHTYRARVRVLSGVRLAKTSALATRGLLSATVLPKARRGFCVVRRVALTALAMLPSSRKCLIDDGSGCLLVAHYRSDYMLIP